MQIQNNFRAEKLWHRRTENEHVWHVMYMDEIVAAPEGPRSKIEKRNHEKSNVLSHIAQLASTLPLQSDTGHVDATESLMCWFRIVVTKTDEVDFNTIRR